MDTITMIEFPTSSAAQSGRFLADVFGWEPTAYGPHYTDVATGGPSLGFQQDAAEAPSAPLVVIRVDDLAAGRERIERAGGVVTVEPFTFPGGRRFHFREPGGNELALWVSE